MTLDLSLLTPDEATFIELRFGLASGYPATLEELATMMGVRRERVRMIEQRLIRKLRASHCGISSTCMS